MAAWSPIFKRSVCSGIDVYNQLNEYARLPPHQVHFAVDGLEDAGEPPGILLGVVDAPEHDVLN